jgi:hypothetical protein
MPRGFGRVAAWLGVLAVAGCAAPTPRINFALEARLLRETTLESLPEGESSAGDAVVRVQREGVGGCTGFLVSPTRVVTAQHCVVQLSKKGELTFDVMRAGQLHVELGPDYLPWGRVAVRTVKACDGWLGGTEADVAMLTLASPVPSEVIPFDVSLTPPSPGGVFDTAGYGSRSTRAVPFTRWPVQQTVRRARWGPLLEGNERELVFRFWSQPGDSGSPVVDRATRQVVGVLSHASDEHEKRDAKTTPSTMAASLARCSDLFAR